jgi:hypothetical protein
MDMKKGLKVCFGTGKRIPAPSKDGNPILTVVLRRERQGNTPKGKSVDEVELNAEKEGQGDNDNTEKSTLNTKKGTKALRRESVRNEENQNKKPRSDDKGSGGEESKQVRKGSEERGGGQGGFVVDLESMSTLMKKKGSGTQAAKKKAATKKKEDSVDKTKGRKKKATFAEPVKAGKKEDKKEAEACNRCIIGLLLE